MKLHLPYFSDKTTLTVQNETVEIKAYQVIVWVSVSSAGAEAWDSRLPKFPAILDIGHTHNLALTEHHLVRWAGIHAASMPWLRWIGKEYKRAPLHSADLWLHTDDDPFKLKIDDGIAVFDGDWPRLPILGLRALTNSKLQTFIYGDARQLIIRTPPKGYILAVLIEETDLVRRDSNS